MGLSVLTVIARAGSGRLGLFSAGSVPPQRVYVRRGRLSERGRGAGLDPLDASCGAGRAARQTAMARGAVQAGGICTGDVDVMVADTAGWAWLRRWEAGGGLGGREDGPRTRSAWVCLASVAQRTERAPDRGERGCRPRSRWRRRSRWQASPRRRAARLSPRPLFVVFSPFFSFSFLKTLARTTVRELDAQSLTVSNPCLPSPSLPPPTTASISVRPRV